MIIHACGSINKHSYPGAQSLPAFRNFRLPQSPRRIEGIIERYDASAVELVGKMLCLDPSRRIGIEDVCEDKYFEVEALRSKENSGALRRRD